MRISDWSSDVCSSDLAVISISAPKASSAFRCRSMGRFPIAQPPGNDTVASPARASKGPSTSIDARILRTMRSEEHTSELQSLMRTSYAVFCLKKKITQTNHLCPTSHQTNNTQIHQHKKHNHYRTTKKVHITNKD